jgi:hypothetical protein
VRLADLGLGGKDINQNCTCSNVVIQRRSIAKRSHSEFGAIAGVVRRAHPRGGILCRLRSAVGRAFATSATRLWAHNSAVECHLHTVEVVGSNPAVPTISKLFRKSSYMP